MGLSKLRLFLILSLIWAIITPDIAIAAKGYYDVPQSHWAHDSVKKIVDDYQLMSGDPSGNFGGSRALSRYEFAKTISRLIEFYNGEIEADRKDFENIVGVMEMFQTELKALEGKMGQANQYVESQNQIIGELNELVIGLAEEVNNLGGGTEEGASEDNAPTRIQVLEARLANTESNVEALQNRGLLVGTLVKGAYNDVRHLGRAVGSAASKTKEKSSGVIKRIKKDKEESVEEVSAELTDQIEDMGAGPVQDNYSEELLQPLTE